MDQWLLMTWLMLIAQTVNPQPHIATYLAQRGADAPRAAQVASVIVQQSARWRADPLMIAAIVTVENPDLTPHARSHAGAQGLMQIMPGWRKSLQRVCGSNLRDDRVNICYGIHVFQQALQEHRSTHRALLAYNGCRTRSRCGQYPQLVLARYRVLNTRVRDAQPALLALLASGTPD